MKVYTIKDIARIAGVSVTTVSRVLNKRPDVNQATREKVEQVMAECHFVGNANARGLKQSEADTVAIILRGRDNPFLNRLAEAVLQHSQGHETAFLLEYLDEQADEFRTALRLSQERRVTGFIFLGGSVYERAKQFQGMDIPMVFATVNAAQAGVTRAGSVIINDESMGYQAMQTLLEAGHQRIAMFGGDREDMSCFSQRFNGALRAIREAGLTFDNALYVTTRFSPHGAYTMALDFFAAHEDVTAVFAMSDTVAMSIVRALADMGRHVPQDVSVIGYDGIEMGEYFVPRLTTIEQPVDAIARESVRMLMGMLENNEEPQHLTIEGTLIRRESVRKIK